MSDVSYARAARTSPKGSRFFNFEAGSWPRSYPDLFLYFNLVTIFSEDDDALRDALPRRGCRSTSPAAFPAWYSHQK